MNTLATTSFTKEFNLTKKGAEDLVETLEKTRRVDIKKNHNVKMVHDKVEIGNLISKIISERAKT